VALAAAATTRVPVPRVEAVRGALAVAGWAALAVIVPWLLGAGSSVLDGDTGALRLILIFAGAGLAATGVVSLRRRRQVVDDHRAAPLAAEA
jgi:hypothetical protein